MSAPRNPAPASRALRVALWIAIPTAIFVSQCAPVRGWCLGPTTRYERGERFGFRVGMTREQALEVVRLRYAGVLTRRDGIGVYVGGDDLRFPRSLAELAAIDTRVQQWRFPQRRRLCAADRNVVLWLRDGRLTSIDDELSITLP